MKLIIEDDEGHKTTVPFMRDELTVGREEGNTIRLTERNVSRRHARFYKQHGQIFVEDLKSYNGIKVNGDRIAGSVPLKEGDLVQIGDFDLAVQGEAGAHVNGANGRASQPTEQMPALPRDLMNMQTSPGMPEVESDPSKPAGPAPKREATALVRMPGERSRGGEAPPAPEGEDVAPDEAPRLVITSTELAGREFACIRSVLTVGRGDECDIVINHRSLSRQHCRIERERSGGWKVVDLGSSNRMQVNDEEYAESALHAGDVITLGHVKLRFVAPGEDYVYSSGGGKRSPVPIFVGAAVGALALGGASMWFITQHKSASATVPRPAVVASKPVEPTQPPAEAKPEPKPEAKPEPQKVAETPPAAKPEQKVAVETPPEKTEPAPDLKAEAKPAPKPEPKAPAPDPDADAKKVSSAIGEANQRLARAHDPAGALAALAVVKELGVGDPAYTAAVKHMQDEQLNQSVVDDAKARAPSADTLARLEAIPDNSVFHAEAAKLLAKYEKQAKLAQKEREREAKLRAKEKAAATPVLAASAEDDKPKRALELKKQGVEKMRNGEFDAALPLFQRAVDLDRKDPDNLKQLARCLARLGRFNDAATYYRQFLTLAPNDPDAPTIRQGLKEYEGK